MTNSLTNWVSMFNSKDFFLSFACPKEGNKEKGTTKTSLKLSLVAQSTHPAAKLPVRTFRGHQPHKKMPFAFKNNWCNKEIKKKLLLLIMTIDAAQLIINSKKQKIMKTKKLFFSIIGMMAGSILISCGPSAEKVDEANAKVEESTQDLKEAQTDAAKQIMEWNKYKMESEEKIKNNEQQILDLKEKWSREDKKMLVKYKKRVEELEEKNNSLKNKITGYKEEGKEKWESFKVEFNHDADELGNALKDLTVRNTKK